MLFFGATGRPVLHRGFLPVMCCAFICCAHVARAETDGSASSGDAGTLDAGTAAESAARQMYDFCDGRWRQGDHNAWDCYVRVPAETVAGRRAREILERADTHYTRAFEHLHDRRDQAARVEIRQGMNIGPVDPHHYFELCEIYWERGLARRAVAHCGRYLAFMNQRRETVEPYTLDRCMEIITGGEPDTGPEAPQAASTPWSVYLAVGLGALAPFALFLVIYFRSGKTLDELIKESPDLHPRIAYAISCLRHELLKHRLGALGDVVRALRDTEGLTKEQMKYLRDRLFGGESLSGLWRIYVETFDRLAGRRLYLSRRDREFRRAWQSVRSLENLRERFDDPDVGVAERLDSIGQQIRGFDRHLKWLSERLCRTTIDGKLLREAVFSVQSEPRAAAVRVDEIRFGEPPPDVHVEVFRSDLLIVLRNLVRNAVLALGDQTDERRVLSVEVDLRTEPTGDESVLIKILDTSPDMMTTDEIYGRRFDRGLGLVAAAVTRYDGSVFVEPGHDEYTKAVVVRFFRAFGEGA